MKTLILIALLFITSNLFAQNFYLDIPVIKDTLIAKTHTRSSTAWRPQDTTWGVGVNTVYDSIAVDTLKGKYNKVYITVLDTAGGTADSTICEGWDIYLQRWCQIGATNQKTGSHVEVLSAGDNTFTEFLLDDKAILYLRRRLVNSGANYKANRTSLQSLKLLNTF